MSWDAWGRKASIATVSAVVTGAATAISLLLAGSHFQVSWLSVRMERDSLRDLAHQLTEQNSRLVSALSEIEARQRRIPPERTFFARVGERQEAFGGALEVTLTAFEHGSGTLPAATLAVRHRGEPLALFRVAVWDSVDYLNYRIHVGNGPWSAGNYCALRVRQVASEQ